jgi:hypothetical protein
VEVCGHKVALWQVPKDLPDKALFHWAWPLANDAAIPFDILVTTTKLGSKTTCVLGKITDVILVLRK